MMCVCYFQTCFVDNNEDLWQEVKTLDCKTNQVQKICKDELDKGKKEKRKKNACADILACTSPICNLQIFCIGCSAASIPHLAPASCWLLAYIHVSTHVCVSFFPFVTTVVYSADPCEILGLYGNLF